MPNILRAVGAYTDAHGYLRLNNNCPPIADQLAIEIEYGPGREISDATVKPVSQCIKDALRFSYAELNPKTLRFVCSRHDPLKSPTPSFITQTIATIIPNPINTTAEIIPATKSQSARPARRVSLPA